MEVTGKLKVIEEIKERGSNGFKTRNVVVTTEDRYPQDLLVEFVGDKCSVLDNFKVGQDVKIGINLRGREWTSPQGEVKYFNTIHGWSIFEQGEATKSETPKEEATVSDDLPF